MDGTIIVIVHNCVLDLLIITTGKSTARGKEYGEYVRRGDSVGVVMDTTKGELSFTLKGVNLGVAFEGIPLDKPLVPCVLLYREGDSVELVI